MVCKNLSMIESRIKKVSRNAIVSVVCHFWQILIGFVLRKLFIKYLGIEYLGYNSVFTNILQMLNLADLGIGIAITSYLYKPLAEGDTKRISSLMYIYKKLYSFIGIVVIFVGAFVSLFLGRLIPDADCSLSYLRLLFFINLVGTVSTYFVAYKRTLIIADQKAYITNLYDTIMYFIVSILQVILFACYPSYIIYLILNILKNIVSNIILSVKANRMYAFISKDVDIRMVNEYRPQIYQYIKDVFISRIGAVVYYSTDNIILSIIKGSLITGFLSNYTLITTQLNTIVVQLLNSVQSTFGNYICTNSDLNKQKQMTDNYFCVNFCIGNFCMICYSLLAQPFIKMFFGENMLLSFSTVLWLGINLMLTFLIQLPAQVFVIYKLYRYDRPIIIISATLNIIISIVLVNYIGINGVFIGTFITSLIYLFSRFFVISKYIYHIHFLHYILKIIKYGFISIASFLLTYCATKEISGNGIVNFGIKAFFVVCLAVFVTAFLLCFSAEFNFLMDKFVPKRLKKLISKRLIFVIMILIVIVSLIMGIGIGGGQSFEDTGNKSYSRSDSYNLEDRLTGRGVFHLSFDDTILIFKELTENNYNSIFDNSTLGWFKELHTRYGVVISCYVYYEADNFNLKQVPEKYKNEFERNSDWLRFGFHSLNESTDYHIGEIASDYNLVVNELKRIVGEKAIDNFIRLQMYQGSLDGIKQLAELLDEPIVGLLTSDDSRSSYYLSPEQNSYIYCHDELFDIETGLWFVSTDLRTEYIDSVESKIKEMDSDSWNNQLGDFVIFTHEWALNIDNMNKIEKLCQYAMDSNYQFCFLEDVLNEHDILC